MKVMRDETFGPVVGVMKVRDSEEALRLANDTRYGLSASVFGEKERAERVARRVECGAVNVNDVLVNYLAMDVPMGGWKESGIGFRHGEYGIKKYCRPESIVVTRFSGKREPTWFPYTKGRRGLVGRIAQAFNARDLKRRLGMRGLTSCPRARHFRCSFSVHIHGRVNAGTSGTLPVASLGSWPSAIS